MAAKFEIVTRDDEDAYWVQHGGERVLSMPPSARWLPVRFLVCAHMKEACHRGLEASLDRLRPYCVWMIMAEDAKDILRQCLYCAGLEGRNNSTAPVD